MTEEAIGAAETRGIVVAPERYGLPRVPSRKIRCSRCDASCWISLRAELGPEDVAVCVVCAMAVVKPTDLIQAAPWVVADLVELLAEGEA